MALSALLELAVTLVVQDPAATMAVDWHAVGECGSAPTLQARVEDFVSHPLPPELLVDVDVVVEIDATQTPLTLELRVDTPEGTTARTLEAPDCASSIDAAAIVVAVALDPLIVAYELESARAQALAAAQPSPAPVEPTSTEPATAEPTPAEPRSAEPTLAESQPAKSGPAGPPGPTSDERRSAGLRGTGSARGDSRPQSLAWSALVLGVFDSGSISRPTGGAALGVVLQTRLFRARLEGAYFGPRTHRPFAEAPAAGVRTQMGELGLASCVAPTLSDFVIASCLGAQLGVVRGRSVGIASPALGHELRLAVSADLALVWQLHPRVGLALRASGSIALRQPAFEIVGLGTAWRAAPAGFRALAGLEIPLTTRNPPRGGQ